LNGGSNKGVELFIGLSSFGASVKEERGQGRQITT